MEYKVIIYIVLIAGYGIIKAIRNAKKKAEEEARNNPQPTAQPATTQMTGRGTQQPKQLTFEELMRQIQQANAPQTEQNIPDEKVYETPVAPRRNLEAENIDSSKEQLKRAKQERKAKVKHYATSEPEVLETFEKSIFKEYATVQTKRNPYAEMLRNPKSVRDALVLTEIFNRKY
jgi:uncharacterized protein YneF (UPF0154 family)